MDVGAVMVWMFAAGLCFLPSLIFFAVKATWVRVAALLLQVVGAFTLAALFQYLTWLQAEAFLGTLAGRLAVFAVVLILLELLAAAAERALGW